MKQKRKKKEEEPVHGLVGGLGQQRIARLHLPASNVLLTAAVLRVSLGRVCLMFETQSVSISISQHQSESAVGINHVLILSNSCSPMALG